MSASAAAVCVKSPEAFRSIGEAAAALDVPQHVLRFWESRFTQIKPVKRAGGRRFYRPGDIDLLKGIRTLLYTDGLTIRGVQKLLKERGPRYVVAIGRGQAPDRRPAMVIEKIVYVEKPARGEAVQPAKAKTRPSRSRAGAQTKTLPLFERTESPHTSAPPSLVAAERVRLAALLDELEGLRRRLTRARRRAE